MRIVFALVSVAIPFLLFGLSKYPYDIVGVLSEGAIIATLGAALLAIAELLERDKLERVKENIDIFFKEILKQSPWRRWPFLKRKYSKRNLTKDLIVTDLKNPLFPLDVGTHRIEIHVPTVQGASQNKWLFLYSKGKLIKSPCSSFPIDNYLLHAKYSPVLPPFSQNNIGNLCPALLAIT
jgi:hypothetical protein